MKIVADENIPLIDEFFNDIGQLVKLDGRSMQNTHVLDADILLVRSVTEVNENLLKNSKVKFVASATAGIEHIDLDYLAEREIKFINTAGSNARSVVEYVISALTWIAQKQGFLLRDKCIGIVGVGNIGSELKKVCDELGIKVLLNDPPLQQQGDSELEFVELDYLIQNSDIISLHLPLTKNCEHETYRLFNAQILELIKPNTILLNTSRGEVIDEEFLKQRQSERKDLTLILDVFQNEPNIDARLVELAELATPHIAGYSLDAKFIATERIYKELTKFYGLPTRTRLGGLTPEPWLKGVSIAPDADLVWSARHLVRSAYDVRDDDAALRLMLKSGEKNGFDKLRKNYPPRRSFSQIKVKLRKSNMELRTLIDAMEFKLSKE